MVNAFVTQFILIRNYIEHKKEEEEEGDGESKKNTHTHTLNSGHTSMAQQTQNETTCHANQFRI